MLRRWNAEAFDRVEKPRAEAAPHHGLQPLDCQKILRRDAACADSIVAAT